MHICKSNVTGVWSYTEKTYIVCCGVVCAADGLSADDSVLRSKRPLSRTKSAVDTSYCTLRESRWLLIHIFTSDHRNNC